MKREITQPNAGRGNLNSKRLQDRWEAAKNTPGWKEPRGLHQHLCHLESLSLSLCLLDTAPLAKGVTILAPFPVQERLATTTLQNPEAKSCLPPHPAHSCSCLQRQKPLEASRCGNLGKYNSHMLGVCGAGYKRASGGQEMTISQSQQQKQGTQWKVP